MFDDFLFRALIAGVGLAIASGPVGCFMVWRRMAYFGDATAHAAMLGVALSLALSMSTFVGVLLVAALMALVLTAFSGKLYAIDTLLGVASHVFLALGLVAVSQLSHIRMDLSSYLFGDILAVTTHDIIVIWLGAALICGLLWWRWEALLTTTLSTDIAVTRGFYAKQEQLVFMLSLAFLVAVAIKLVGALLISAILVVPPATARPFSSTPERMVLLAIIVGVASVVGGLAMSMAADTPSGPSIVVAAGAFFVFSNALSAVLAAIKRR